MDGSANVSMTAAVMELDEGEEDDEDVAAPKGRETDSLMQWRHDNRNKQTLVFQVQILLCSPGSLRDKSSQSLHRSNKTWCISSNKETLNYMRSNKKGEIRECSCKDQRGKSNQVPSPLRDGNKREDRLSVIMKQISKRSLDSLEKYL